MSSISQGGVLSPDLFTIRFGLFGPVAIGFAEGDGQGVAIGRPGPAADGSFGKVGQLSSFAPFGLEDVDLRFSIVASRREADLASIGRPSRP